MSRVDRPDKVVWRQVNRSAQEGMRNAASQDERDRWNYSYTMSHPANWRMERAWQAICASVGDCSCDSCRQKQKLTPPKAD
jgi:hypothetical protein